MTQSRDVSNRGLTLIESVAAVIVLAIAVPPTLSMLQTVEGRRVDSIGVTRATLYAQAVMEQIIADVASQEPGMGFSALADSVIYSDSLDSRLASIDEVYAGVGLSRTLLIGPLSDAEGVVNGDPAADKFRRVQVEVTFATHDGYETLPITHMLTEISP